MEAVRSVVELARENDYHKSRADKFENFFKDLVGRSVTFRVKYSRKYKYYHCVVDKFTGDGWELIQDTDEDQALGFYATLYDLIKGNLWINKSK